MKININQKPNKLINGKNPYLLQHAFNPVDWFPWCKEAFEKARIENKPVFLSIGYSTCHWCHVMAHESFEDKEIAGMMNETFINIKVDREERPDIDSIYMQVCQMITGSGGWPLTVIMTPDKKPFFAGTYFPKESVYGRIGMKELIPKINELWKNRKEDIILSAEDVFQKIQTRSQTSSSAELNKDIFMDTFNLLEDGFDEEFGGFGGKPKFPVPHNLTFLMNYYYFLNDSFLSIVITDRTDTKANWALKMVEKTLQKMRMGGICDHVGFGFHRYSTDRFWLVPHFEKMLYDQALLAIAYTEAWKLTKKDEYKKTVYEILNYVSKELTSEESGFYCADDADSEGLEGKFYLWTLNEIKEILTTDIRQPTTDKQLPTQNSQLKTYKNELDLALRIFNIKEDGNFHDERTGKYNGKNILHLTKTIEELAKEFRMTPGDLLFKIESIRNSLFAAREKRIHPFKDKKILTDWNGLTMSAFAKAGKIFDDETFIRTAENNYKFIKSNLRNESGLLHSHGTQITGNLDDYAFLSWGLLELYDATLNINYLKEAATLQEILFKHFWDESASGFFFTSDDSEELILRKKELYDGAIPSGNSVQLSNLIKLYKLTGDSKYNEFIIKLISEFSGQVNSHPPAYTHFIGSYFLYEYASTEIVFVANSKEEIKPFLDNIGKSNQNNLYILLKDNQNNKDIEKLCQFTKGMEMLDGRPTAYICKNFACEMPINNIEEFIQKIGQ